MIQIFKKIIYALFFIALFFGLKVFALENYASIYFQAESNLEVNQASRVSVLVDSTQPVNAYLFEILYNPEEIHIQSVNTGGSIIDVKQSEPKINGDGKINVSGGSTNPFSGQKGLLLSLNVLPIKQGSIDLQIKNASIYLANGKGTKIIPNLKKITFNAKNSNNINQEETSIDRVAPIIEFAEISKDPITPSQNLLIFKVNDLDSGIKSITAERKQWFSWSKAQEIINPTSISKNVWSVRIIVVDWSGNKTETIVYNWLAFWINLLPVLILLLIFVIIVINRIIRKKQAIINK